MVQEPTNRVERRLSAILAADVVGYSRLMGLDEVGTLNILRGHRAVSDALVAKYGGRIVKTTGDGVLLEFSSVVDAVECAVAVQAVMAERNDGLPEERRMLFRLGVNLGDILIEGDGILGDGVNIAARLESIAEPGGMFAAAGFRLWRRLVRARRIRSARASAPIRHKRQPAVGWKRRAELDEARPARVSAKPR